MSASGCGRDGRSGGHGGGTCPACRCGRGCGHGGGTAIACGPGSVRALATCIQVLNSREGVSASETPRLRAVQSSNMQRSVMLGMKCPQEDHTDRSHNTKIEGMRRREHLSTP